VHVGDLDLICNWLGNRRWVDSLDWAGSEDWDIAADVEWDVRGQPAGAVKAVGPLSFVRVYKAGHMVRVAACEASVRTAHGMFQVLQPGAQVGGVVMDCWCSQHVQVACVSTARPHSDIERLLFILTTLVCRCPWTSRSTRWP
jgi:hypothetical protein